MSAHCQKCFASGTRGKSCMKFLCSLRPIPFHLNQPRPPPISLREIPFCHVQFGRPTKRREEKERGEEGGRKGTTGLTNNPVKTNRGSQPPPISRSISLLLPLLPPSLLLLPLLFSSFRFSFFFFFFFLINIFFYHGDTREKFYRIESVFERKIDNFKREK